MKKIIILLVIAGLSLTACFKVENDTNPGQIITHDQLSEDYKVCIIGDSGKHNAGQRVVADVLAKEGCNQVRHTGDIIYPSGISNAEDPRFQTHFYDYYGEMIESGIPYYMSAGNHDYKKNAGAWIDLAKKHENIKFPSMYFMDVFKDICFITIDTNSQFIQQNNWIKDLKKDYANTCKLTLAFGHHPRYSSGRHGNAMFFVKTFLKSSIVGNVDAYFAGHDHHQEDIGIKGGTHFFVTGAAASLRPVKYVPPFWAQSKRGYQTFTIHYENGVPYIKYFFYSIDFETSEKKMEHSGEVRAATSISK